MRYIYNKNIEETKMSKPFLNIMAKVQKLNEAQNCLSFMRDEELWDMLENKQVSLLFKMFKWYNEKYGVELTVSMEHLKELVDLDFAIDFECQKNVCSIEDAIISGEH